MKDVAFLEVRPLSSQLVQFKKLSKAPIGWKKAGPPKQPLCFWTCKQVSDALPGIRTLQLITVVLIFLLDRRTASGLPLMAQLLSSS